MGPPKRAQHLTPGAKAKQRRELIASIVLTAVLIACVALTGYVWSVR